MFPYTSLPIGKLRSSQDKTDVEHALKARYAQSLSRSGKEGVAALKITVFFSSCSNSICHFLLIYILYFNGSVV